MQTTLLPVIAAAFFLALSGCVTATVSTLASNEDVQEAAADGLAELLDF